MPTYSYTTLDDPLGTGVTIANGINAAGWVVGQYSVSSGYQGFLYSNGTYTSLGGPSNVALGAVALGVNDNAQIVGYYTDAARLNHGFLYTGGNYITLDDPWRVVTSTELAQLRRVSTLRARSSAITPTVMVPITVFFTAMVVTPLSTIP